MVTFVTNCETFVSGNTVVNGGMHVVVAVRGDRAQKRDLKRDPGKQLPLSHRCAPAGSPAETLPMAMPSPMPMSWQAIERSSARRYSIPASELPAAAWAALVLARA